MISIMQTQGWEFLHGNPKIKNKRKGPEREYKGNVNFNPVGRKKKINK